MYWRKACDAHPNIFGLNERWEKPTRLHVNHRRVGGFKAKFTAKHLHFSDYNRPSFIMSGRKNPRMNKSGNSLPPPPETSSLHFALLLSQDRARFECLNKDRRSRFFNIEENSRKIYTNKWKKNTIDACQSERELPDIIVVSNYTKIWEIASIKESSRCWPNGKASDDVRELKSGTLSLDDVVTRAMERVCLFLSRLALIPSERTEKARTIIASEAVEESHGGLQNGSCFIERAEDK